MLKVILSESSTIHCFEQTNTAIHVNDPIAQIEIQKWNQYCQVSLSIIFSILYFILLN